MVSTILLSGCESSTRVITARCNACEGDSFTEEDCAAWAAEVRCKSFELQPTTTGRCANACVFSECELTPACLRPAGLGRDGAVEGDGAATGDGAADLDGAVDTDAAIGTDAAAEIDSEVMTDGS